MVPTLLVRQFPFLKFYSDIPPQGVRPVVPGSDTDALDPIHVAKKVGQWQQAIEGK
jgi:hypothetical protein